MKHIIRIRAPTWAIKLDMLVQPDPGVAMIYIILSRDANFRLGGLAELSQIPN